MTCKLATIRIIYCVVDSVQLPPDELAPYEWMPIECVGEYDHSREIVVQPRTCVAPDARGDNLPDHVNKVWQARSFFCYKFRRYLFSTGIDTAVDVCIRVRKQLVNYWSASIHANAATALGRVDSRAAWMGVA